MTKYRRLLLIIFMVGFACSLFVPAGEALRLPQRVNQAQTSNPISVTRELASPAISPAFARTSDNRINAPAGTITVVTHYRQNLDTGLADIPGSQTATFTKQTFTDLDCTTGGGAVTTVTGVNSSTGHVINLGSGSVLITPALTSDQNGPFTGSWIPASGNFGNFTNKPNSAICVQNTVTDTFKALYHVGVVLNDSATCNTPKTDFNLTETVCAKVYGDPRSYCAPGPNRAFNVLFFDPHGQTRQTSPDLPTGDLQTTTYLLPSTNTEGPPGTENRGRWLAQPKPKCAAAVSNSPFFVHNPGAPAADFSITKTPLTNQVRTGGTVEYDIRVFNFNGPDPANDVSWTDTLPTGTTLHSFTRISGPAFNCTTPAIGANGTITCNAFGPLQRVSAVNEPNVAVFRLVLKNVSAASPFDNTATVTSSTTDLPSGAFANSSTATVTVTTNCSFTDGCVPDMNVTPNTTCPDGQPGRIVSWANPATAGTCTIAPNPASGSCFSAGTTTVTYNSASGSATCSFRITVLASPTASDGDVSGTIVDNVGNPIEGVTINLGGSQTRKTITDGNGRYVFENVETNGFYTVTPARANYQFSPSDRSFTQIGQSTEAVFTANRVADGRNPIDSPEYFVRQHYLDFLGREPDEAGFNFWSDQMLQCGTDATCLESRTINVSAAYFLSIEFKQTGGLVDGLYRASFGRAPRYAEFIPDTRLVSRDVIVGRGDWALQLERNKQAFVDAWLERGDFHAAYANLSNAEFVDRLISNANGFNGDRDALVNGLNSDLERSAALRQVVENDGFVQAKTNGMFVLIEYFGYLRRDPDEAGYQFWLHKLNQFGGNFEQAEMVKAFINSGEYRNRFRR